MSAYYLLIGVWTEVCERCHFLLFFPMRLLVAWFPALGSAEGCLVKESWWWGERERGGSECLQWVTLSLWSSSWKHSSCCERWAQPNCTCVGGWMFSPIWLLAHVFLLVGQPFDSSLFTSLTLPLQDWKSLRKDVHRYFWVVNIWILVKAGHTLNQTPPDQERAAIFWSMCGRLPFRSQSFDWDKLKNVCQSAVVTNPLQPLISVFWQQPVPCPGGSSSFHLVKAGVLPKKKNFLACHSAY